MSLHNFMINLQNVTEVADGDLMSYRRRLQRMVSLCDCELASRDIGHELQAQGKSEQVAKLRKTLLNDPADEDHVTAEMTQSRIRDIEWDRYKTSTTKGVDLINVMLGMKSDMTNRRARLILGINYRLLQSLLRHPAFKKTSRGNFTLSQDFIEAMNAGLVMKGCSLVVTTPQTPSPS